jgi:hypothetical protein
MGHAQTEGISRREGILLFKLPEFFQSCRASVFLHSGIFVHCDLLFATDLGWRHLAAEAKVVPDGVDLFFGVAVEQFR